ncbi:UDP-2,3-diacylglucosamine diphosphatase [Flavobacterium rhizosphaerae]|uniref:UDP-2,3-diacylglucosamine diphosphatase n=1 Tax=Flavobacterium rhizosphaerae TaxID=3163298 RepID=A0ABW8YZD5_9FLAO
MKKRNVDVVVISDVHLGTYGCHAKELLAYLADIKPKTLILNGDIIDIWNFRKSYFPKSHLKVVKRLLNFAAKGTKVYYITGNHDEMLRKFADTEMGNFTIVNKVVLELDGEKAWFFHGDIFDNSVHHAKWIAKLGGIGYDYLILLNRFINWILVKMGREPYSLSKKIKAGVKKAVKFISDFETTAAELAIENNYTYVVCGHIHEPKIIKKQNKKGEVLYLNSGDWIENLTALEYNKGQWKMYQHSNEKVKDAEIYTDTETEFIDNPQLLATLLFDKK